MRIQHNIMAMNAYRNYSSNVSAMQKNLEKLSSGYKINRAGDDAAGLAISEKMRAQITGLETAQKNAKDGISLVQTAEGALTEVHDMLNRMVELATQSANGTYDNTTDRKQMQKEVDQLLAEIDRIADSSNFNGIKLLDGSMDANGTIHDTGSTSALVNFVPANGTGTSKLPSVGTTLGTSTILHAGAADPDATGTEFSVDLHDIKFDAREGDSITITLGDSTGTLGTDYATIKLTALKTQDDPITGEDLVNAIAGGTDADNKYKVTINGTDLAAGDEVKFTLKGTDVEIKTTGAATGRLDMVQSAVPDTDSKVIDGNMAVAIASTRGTGITGSITTATATPANEDTAGQKTKYTYDLTGLTDLGKGKYNVSIGGQTVQIELTADDNDAAAVATAIKTAIDAGDGFADGMDTDSKYSVTVTGNTVVFEASANNVAEDTGAGTPAKNATHITGNINIARDESDRTTTGTNSIKGDHNVQTTDIKNVAAAGAERLASTTITLTDKMIVDGGSMLIGKTHYTFTTDEAAKGDPTKGVYIGDVVDADGKFTNNAANLTKVARRLTDAAADNDVWTVGTGSTAGKLTFVEKTDGAGAGTGSTVDGVDLTTEVGIGKTLGYKGLDVDPTQGKSLTLQIGDTAEDFNQLTVNIKDMHAESLGLEGLKINEQGLAQGAIDKIKKAINTVSDVRGDLGATQNRLDHTMNNLSVMEENIQDAESSIRDVDVAKEMMAYTKNNILIQSAQAMLAQANQVPQGVLQLLQ